MSSRDRWSCWLSSLCQVDWGWTDRQLSACRSKSQYKFNITLLYSCNSWFCCSLPQWRHPPRGTQQHPCGLQNLLPPVSRSLGKKQYQINKFHQLKSSNPLIYCCGYREAGCHLRCRHTLKAERQHQCLQGWYSERQTRLDSTPPTWEKASMAKFIYFTMSDRFSVTVNIQNSSRFKAILFTMRKILATLQSFVSWLQVLRVGPQRPAWLPALLPQNHLSLAQTQSLRHTRQISQEFDTDTIQPSHSRHLSVPNTSHFPTCWGLFGGIDGSRLVIWASGCHLLTVSLSVCLASSSVLRKKKIKKKSKCISEALIS